MNPLRLTDEQGDWLEIAEVHDDVLRSNPFAGVLAGGPDEEHTVVWLTRADATALVHWLVDALGEATP